MRARVFFLVACAVAVGAAFAACATGQTSGGNEDASCTTCGNDAGPVGDADASVKPGPDGACPSGEIACNQDSGGVCVDTKTDPGHCGSCTSSCIPQLEACDGGVCASLCGQKTLCVFDAGVDGGEAGAPHCADLQNDIDDCGKCGNACGGQDASCSQGVCSCGHGTQNFAFTGSTATFVVPCGITSVTVSVWGAQGANAQDVLSSVHTAGLGGTASGTLTVSPGDTLYVNVGGQGSTSGTGGFNGGGAGGSSTAGSGCSGGPAGGGGGMSDVRHGGTALSNVVIAAAGGGGSGRDYCNGTCVPCGCGGGNGGGGGATGTSGGAASNCGYGYPGSGINGGQGGTQSAGGNGGTGDGAGTSGSPGTQGTGGGGAAGSYDVAGGGGGGGYYGGGGGGGAASGSGVGGGGGAGGSSYVGGVTSGTTSSGVQSSDGKVTITW